MIFIYYNWFSHLCCVFRKNNDELELGQRMIHAYTFRTFSLDLGFLNILEVGEGGVIVILI